MCLFKVAKPGRAVKPWAGPEPADADPKAGGDAGIHRALTRATRLQMPRSPRRTPAGNRGRRWLGRLSGARLLAGVLLVAHALALGTATAARTWKLVVHLATEHHHGAASHHEHAVAAAPEAEHPQHRAHGHTHATDVPVAESEPHRHGDTVHTHEQAPEEHPEQLIPTLSKFCLVAGSPLPIPADAMHRLAAAEARPPRVTFPIELPPPRLVG